MHRNSPKNVEPSGVIIHFGERSKDFYIFVHSMNLNKKSRVPYNSVGRSSLFIAKSIAWRQLAFNSVGRSSLCIAKVDQLSTTDLPIIWHCTCTVNVDEATFSVHTWMQFLATMVVNTWECGHLDEMLKQRLFHQGQLSHRRPTMELVSMGHEYDYTKYFHLICCTVVVQRLVHL